MDGARGGRGVVVCPGGVQIAPTLIHRRFWWLVVLLLAAMAIAEFSSARQESQTYDEAEHLSFGYAALARGDFSLGPEHPPLGRMLAALPLLLIRPALPALAPGSATTDEFAFGAGFLYRNRIPADTLLLLGRSVIMALSLGLGLLLALWTRRWFGAGPALLALFLYAFDPTIIAHSRYVTTDLIAALTIFLACWTWAGYLLDRRAARLALSGVALGGALLSKFSAVILLPIFALLYLVRCWQEKDGVADPAHRISLPHFLRAGAACLLAASLTIYAGYRFETRTALSDPQAAAVLAALPHHGVPVPHPFGALRRLNPASPVHRALYWAAAHCPVPAYSFWKGLYLIGAYHQQGHRAYLMGRWTEQGRILYFPVAFAVKTPAGTLLLFMCSLVVVVWRAAGVAKGQRKSALRALPFAWFVVMIPPAVYFLFSVAANLNIGVRHVLPVYPFLLMWIAAVLLGAPGDRLRRARRAAILSLACCLLAVESIAIYPDYLAFFNFFCGGPKAGPRYLLDSNIDWGQDLKKLRRYVDSRQIPYVCLSYFGEADPAYYGLVARPLPPLNHAAALQDLDCFAAISVTDLYSRDGAFSTLRSLPPTARIGYSIYVYDERKRVARPPIP
jgi:hypothetical protein